MISSWIEVIWSNETLLLGLGVFSLLTFIISLLVIPVLVVRIPQDYFSSEKRHVSVWSHQHFLIRWTVLVIKNVIGVLLLILGIAMLVLPGQGLLTILIGLVCLNFPGKFHLERWLIRQKAIASTVSWLRKRANKPPLIID